MAAPSPLLKSPLPGYIFPPGSTWSGGAFGVISTLAQHIATGRGKGTDIANFPTTEGAPVRLMRDGTCYQKYIQPMHNPPEIGDGALIVRFKHAEGNTGYAHLSKFGAVYIGKFYKAGTIVGYVGKTGTSHPHLHTHWQGNDGIHREMYVRLEQSRNLQFNAGVVGVNIRTAPGLAGAVWGSCQAAGLVRKSDGKVVAPHDAVLIRRRTVTVVKDGYEWMPFTLAGAAVWSARPFMHFV
jgi:murein DD-endopeptidase MepM/ murein hydrolase activator NlpD